MEHKSDHHRSRHCTYCSGGIWWFYCLCSHLHGFRIPTSVAPLSSGVGRYRGRQSKKGCSPVRGKSRATGIWRGNIYDSQENM